MSVLLVLRSNRFCSFRKFVEFYCFARLNFTHFNLRMFLYTLSLSHTHTHTHTHTQNIRTDGCTKRRRHSQIWTMSTAALRNFCHGFGPSVSECWGMEHCYSSLAINGSSLGSVSSYQWTTDVGLGPMRMRPVYCRQNNIPSSET